MSRRRRRAPRPRRRAARRPNPAGGPPPGFAEALGGHSRMLRWVEWRGGDVGHRLNVRTLPEYRGGGADLTYERVGYLRNGGAFVEALRTGGWGLPDEPDGFDYAA